MRIGVVVSARTASTRLPGKALLNIMGYPVIIFILSRLSKINLNIQIILATTDLNSDDILTEIVLKQGFMVFRGSSEDVVKRHIDLADYYGFDFIVRITGDCPFVNGEIVEVCCKQFDFDGNIFLGTTKNSFPQGLDCEIISVNALKEYWPVMTDLEKEHLTIKFYSDQFSKNIQTFIKPNDWIDSEDTYLLDTKRDYEKITSLASNLSGIHFAIPELNNRN